MNYSDMSQTEPRHVLMFEKMFKSFKIKIFAELAQICESLDHFPSNGTNVFREYYGNGLFEPLKYP